MYMIGAEKHIRAYVMYFSPLPQKQNAEGLDDAQLWAQIFNGAVQRPLGGRLQQ